jgi:hypothetical protein
MATCAEVAIRLSTALDEMPSRLTRTVDALQAKGLLPLGSRGGGFTTPHLQPQHVRNLALAMACAENIRRDSAAAARRYSALVQGAEVEVVTIANRRDGSVLTHTERKPADRSMHLALLHGFGNTLGHHIDGLLLTAARNRDLRDFAWDAVSITFVLDDEFPEAAMHFEFGMGYSRRRRIETLRYQIKHPDDMPAHEPAPGALRRTVRMPFALIETMTDLVADTLSRTNLKELKYAEYPTDRV